MPPHGVLHALLERHRPCRHAVVEDGAGLGARDRADAVAHAHRGVAHDLVLVGRDVFAREPDRRAHGAVGMDGVARPVARGVVEIEPAGKRHGHGLAAEFLREQLGDRLHRLVVAGAAVQEEDADLVAVGAARDARSVGGLVDRHAQIPVEPERMNAEDVLGLPKRQIGPRQHGLRTRDGFIARDGFRRLPVEFGCGHTHGCVSFCRSGDYPAHVAALQLHVKCRPDIPAMAER